MAIVKVQSKSVATGTGTTSATASGDAYSTNTTPGSLLVLVARSSASWSSGGNAPPVISTPITSGFTWAGGPTATYFNSVTQSAQRVSFFYISNAGAMSSVTSTSVTATRSGADSTNVSFTAYEFSGVAVSPTDVSVTLSTQTSSPISAGSLSTSGTALIFAACVAEATVTTGSGFTAGAVASEQYILNQSSGSISTAFGANTGSEKWGACALDFLAASTSSSVTTQSILIGF